MIDTNLSIDKKLNISRFENWKMCMDGKLPYWMPFTDDLEKFQPRFIPENVARGNVKDAEPPIPDEQKGGPDIFGVEWVYVPTVGGSMVQPGNPLMEDACDWKDVVKMPDPLSWDWENAGKINRKYLKGRHVMYKVFTGFFERLIAFMDMENALVAMIDDEQQEAIKEFFDQNADMYCTYFRKLKETFPEIELIYFHDDWGHGRAPFFSLEIIMDMIVPYLKRVIDCTHELGMYFQMHSCGKNGDLIPAYIAAGADYWSGQAGINDKAAQYEEWGDKLKFGIDPPAIAQDQNASEEEVIEAAQEFVNHYCSDFENKPCLLETRGCTRLWWRCVEYLSYEVFEDKREKGVA